MSHRDEVEELRDECHRLMGELDSTIARADEMHEHMVEQRDALAAEVRQWVDAHAVVSRELAQWKSDFADMVNDYDHRIWRLNAALDAKERHTKALNRGARKNRIGIDADGNGWWIAADRWSMIPTSPTNGPIATPVTYYVPEGNVDDWRALYHRARTAMLEYRDAFDEASQAVSNAQATVNAARSAMRALARVREGSASMRSIGGLTGQFNGTQVADWLDGLLAGDADA